MHNICMSKVRINMYLEAEDRQMATLHHLSSERIKGHLATAVPCIGGRGNDLLPPAKQPLRSIDVTLHQSACRTSGGGLFHVPSLCLLVDACPEVHHARW